MQVGMGEPPFFLCLLACATWRPLPHEDLLTQVWRPLPREHAMPKANGTKFLGALQVFLSQETHEAHAWYESVGSIVVL